MLIISSYSIRRKFCFPLSNFHRSTIFFFWSPYIHRCQATNNVDAKDGSGVICLHGFFSIGYLNGERTVVLRWISMSCFLRNRNSVAAANCSFTVVCCFSHLDCIFLFSHSGQEIILHSLFRKNNVISIWFYAVKIIKIIIKSHMQ